MAKPTVTCKLSGQLVGNILPENGRQVETKDVRRRQLIDDIALGVGDPNLALAVHRNAPWTAGVGSKQCGLSPRQAKAIADLKPAGARWVALSKPDFADPIRIKRDDARRAAIRRGCVIPSPMAQGAG